MGERPWLPYWILLPVFVLVVASSVSSLRTHCEEEPLYSFRVVHAYPHDPNAFTQGLLFDDGYLYESTGLYGESSLRKVRLCDGAVIQKVHLPDHLFGEGLVILGDRVIQLTWREHQGLVYDKATFALIDTFAYETEGWGLTTDGEFLIMSDGSSHLTYLDPHTFEPVRMISVTSRRGPVALLNELEFIKGEIFANIWLTDQIDRIDPQSGQVTGWIDLEGLLRDQDREGYEVDVLNGIAYDHNADRLFVTGKLWPLLFHIELLGE